MTRSSLWKLLGPTLGVLGGCAPVQIGTSADTASSGGSASGGSPVLQSGGSGPALSGGLGSAGTTGRAATGGTTGGLGPAPGGSARSPAGGLGGTAADAGMVSTGGTRALGGATAIEGGSPSGGWTARGGSSAAGSSSAAGGSAGGEGGASPGGSPQAGGGTTGEEAGAAGCGAGSAGSAGQAGTAGSAPNPCIDGTLSISGRLTSPRGEPWSGILITLGGDAARTTTTDANGDYAFGELCAGSYQLEPSAPALAFCTASASLPNLRQHAVEDFTGSAAGCDQAIHRPRVRVLIYDPYVTATNGQTVPLSVARGWEDPAQLAEQLRRAIESITNGHVKYSIVDRQVVTKFPVKADGYQYPESAYLACLEDATNCHPADEANYAAILSEHGLCEAAAAGAIDEVWLFGAPYFGFWPTRLAGREPFDLGSPPLAAMSCPRLLPIMGFNYERPLANLLDALMGRAEGTLTRVYGSWEEDRMENNLDRFGLVAFQSPSYGLSGCGSRLYAPNSTSEYEYGNQTDPVRSYCDDFFNYPNLGDPTAVSTPVTCTAWGCSEYGYPRYWLSHLPRASGYGSDGKAADWWRYIVFPQEVLPVAPLACSSAYQSGWCEQVQDGKFGVCNDGEWATAGVPTGWIEFDFAAPREVRSVTLYDRACDERVLAGHLVFSDGSDPIAFDALENTGLTPRTLTFASPKTLSWLRVVIDESTGVNPGLGEIVLEP